MPALVEFAIVRQVCLGNHAEQSAAMDDQRAIVEPSAPAQRRAGDDNRRQILRGGDEMAGRLFHGVQQAGLMEQIVDGIGRQAELRQRQKRGGFLMRGLSHLDRARDVEGRIGHAHGGRADADAGEAVRIDRME